MIPPIDVRACCFHSASLCTLEYVTALFIPAVGRNFDEILRIIDALQLSAKYPIATPVNWTPGKDVMIQPSCSDADARSKVGPFITADLPSGKQYVRYAPDPTGQTKP